MFTGRCARDLKVWLGKEAEAARSNEGLARRFVEECRRRQVILPELSVLERLCAAHSLPQRDAYRRELGDAMRMRLDRLLTEEADSGVSRFVWLRRFEVGRNPADINGLLDRLELLQGFDHPSDLLEVQVLTEQYRRTYNRLRPPAPETTWSTDPVPVLAGLT